MNQKDIVSSLRYSKEKKPGTSNITKKPIYILPEIPLRKLAKTASIKTNGNNKNEIDNNNYNNNANYNNNYNNYDNNYNNNNSNYRTPQPLYNNNNNNFNNNISNYQHHPTPNGTKIRQAGQNFFN